MIDYCIDRPAMQLVRVQTDSRRVAKWLSLYFGRYFKLNSSSTSEIIQVTELNDLNFKIEYGDNVLITDSFVKDFSDMLMKITVCDPNVLVLHGATLEYLNEAYIFLAPTTGGKTTLSSFLCEKDLGYITDDLTIIDCHTQLVIPVIKPLHLRPKSLKILSNFYGLQIKTYYLDDGHTKRRIYNPLNTHNQETPIHGFYFLKRNDNLNRLSKVPNVDKLFLLLKSLMFHKNMNKAAIEDISKLLNYPCYYLEYCDLNYVEKIIKDKGDH